MVYSTLLTFLVFLTVVEFRAVLLFTWTYIGYIFIVYSGVEGYFSTPIVDHIVSTLFTIMWMDFAFDHIMIPLRLKEYLLVSSIGIRR